jgi:uncharacterized protein YuzE
VHEPIGVKIDREAEAGYVRYRGLAPGERVARTQRFGEDINVDYNAANDVLGIEILAFDEPALAVARTVAAQHGLVFPRNVGGATVTERREA